MSSKHNEETRAVLDAADMLAEFANLEPANVDAFRKRHSDFALPAWWEYQSDLAESSGLSKHWQLTQKYVQEAWIIWVSGSEFFLNKWLRLLTSVFDPTALLEIMFPLSSRVHPAFADATELAEMTPYHKAIEFIAREPWRAKVCEECHMRFVADHAKRKYCSGTDGAKCAARAIQRRHLEWWHEHGAKLRSKRNMRIKRTSKNTKSSKIFSKDLR